MANVEFHDFSIEVKNKMDSKIKATLEGCAGELESQVKRNSRVDTGKTKNSFRHGITGNFASGAWTAHIGSNEENAIWEEFGTGEYAIAGNGRKGGWFYEDAEGNGHFTRGKKPSRAFWNAFNTKKDKIIKRLQKALGGK